MTPLYIMEENKMLTKDNLYRCYSDRLTKYLNEHGLPYLLIAIDVVTGKKFWLFEKTPELFSYMDEWKNKR